MSPHLDPGIRRNSPCYCKSGRRYKDCHGSPCGEAGSTAHEVQRCKQQGLGRPIISELTNGGRSIVVGARGLIGGWRTFEEFLLYYINDVLTLDTLPLPNAHPLLPWQATLAAYLREAEAQQMHHEYASAPVTGAAIGYLGLAYNLYLLEHNAALTRDSDSQDRLREYFRRLLIRLKVCDQFHGAYYESFICAYFILAGFDLIPEDEGDSNTGHHEFTATHRISGSQYAVEAKSNQPGKVKARFLKKLRESLLKPTPLARIIFIEINLSNDIAGSPENWMQQVSGEVNASAQTMEIDGNPAPPAYVIVTNTPYHYELNQTNTICALVGLGFKVADFGYGKSFANLTSEFLANKKHQDVISVLDAVEAYGVPSTFDGSIPELTYGKEEQRWVVGDQYDLSEQGAGIGTLTSAQVLPDGKTAHLFFSFPDSRHARQAITLTDMEQAIYRRHPETFFGAHIRPTILVTSKLELFELIYGLNQNTPRATLLERLNDADDTARVATLSDEELLLEYCEREALARAADAEEAAVGEPIPVALKLPL